jgi:dTMP kinase
MHGRMVVFEGVDGSGKSTQVELLKNFLNSKRKKFSYYKFPQYEKTFHGRIVSRFLHGEFGKINEVSPHLISLAYAMDRATAKDDLYADLNKGKLIIADRYVASSKAHHGAKFEGAKRTEFINWIDELEYLENKMPREDLTILLDIPISVSFELQKKMAKKKDIHEGSKSYLEIVREVYLKLAKDKHWVVVSSVEDSELRSKDEIHAEIVSLLKKRRII